MNCARRADEELHAKTPSPARVKRDFARFAMSKIEMKSQRATANAAERKRSRSEADTGRRIGLCFGLCLFFGREKRSRFSRRAELLRPFRVARAEASDRGGPQLTLLWAPQASTR